MEMSGLGYRCSAGESFDSVALMVYGDEKYAAELLCANPELCGKLIFDGGEILKLPMIDEIETEDEDSVPVEEAPWKV